MKSALKKPQVRIQHQAVPIVKPSQVSMSKDGSWLILRFGGVYSVLLSRNFLMAVLNRKVGNNQ